MSCPSSVVEVAPWVWWFMLGQVLLVALMLAVGVGWMLGAGRWVDRKNVGKG